MTDLKDLEERIAENEAHGLYTSPAVRELIEELKRLRHEVADLQMLRDEHLIDNLHATEEGRNEERAAVVVWLRKEAVSHRRDGFPIAAYTMQERADAIERGEHRREEER
jgi:hypothetical protein